MRESLVVLWNQNYPIDVLCTIFSYLTVIMNGLSVSCQILSALMIEPVVYINCKPLFAGMFTD